jgi:serpin B
MTSIRNIAPTTEFGINLLRNQVERNPDKNVWLSPASVSIAVGMTANGARANTYDNMVKALCLKHEDVAANNNGYANLIASLTDDSLGVQLAIATSLWGRKDYKFRDEFISANKKFFRSEVFSRDLTREETLAEIHQWVSDGTFTKIDKLLDGPLTPDDLMLLLSAVYMKGLWKTRFDKKRTREMEFRLAGGASKEHPLMFLPSGFRQGWNDQARIAVLPFGDTEQRANLIAMVPHRGKKVEDVIRGLNPDSLWKALNGCEEGEGGLYFPRFAMEYETNLNETMKDLGMEDAFDGRCNLKGMLEDENENPYIAEIKHKAVGQFDEYGAVVAAATSVKTTLECMGPSEFMVDEPYVQFIIDKDTGAMPFAGVVADPQRITKETDWSDMTDADSASETAEEEGDI